MLIHANMFSNLSTNHEDLMLFAKEDTEDVTGGGPEVRNRMIMKNKSLPKRIQEGTDKEKKSVWNILDLMANEFLHEVDGESDGIAIFVLKITRMTIGMAYGLIIFHKGSTLLLETLSKTKVKHTWQTPVQRTDMLKIRNLTQDEDIRQLGLKKLGSILGRDLLSNDDPHTFTFVFPQNRDVFSHFGDENHKEYCWFCHVTVRKLKKCICAGCLVARYCTLGCQEKDWNRHRDYCMMKKARREEKTSISKMKKNVFIDWDQEVD